jgi:predicted dehydrogenase
MAVPKNLNYEMWLGSTPLVYYTEKRVHPQANNLRARYDRPGWLRCDQFGAGMITGWGVHHIDIAHWAMGTEDSGPVEIRAKAEFPKKGLWDVHGPYQVEAKYANGVMVHISDKYPNGLKFVGEKGWIWVSRGGSTATASDPVSAQSSKPLDASDPAILKSVIEPNEIHLHASPQNDHHLDWLTSIQTRKEPAAPAEAGHRSCSACLISHIAMKLGRKLTWDPQKERFVNDEQANGMLSRPQREPYGTESFLAKVGKKA